jgi:hypothetical protein
MRRAVEIYQFFGVNERDCVLSTQELQCGGDSSARALAMTSVACQHGIEVWDVARRVCKFKHAGGEFA